MNEMSVSAKILETLEIELRACRQLYFELNKEDMIRFASKIKISENSLTEFNKLNTALWETKQIVSENCFVAVGEHWDFSLGKELPAEKDIKFKSFCFKLVPSTKLLNMGALYLGLNSKWTFGGRFSIDQDYLNFRQGDFLMRHLEDWHMGDPPPVDVYSYILKILGPKSGMRP